MPFPTTKEVIAASRQLLVEEQQAGNSIDWEPLTPGPSGLFDLAREVKPEDSPQAIANRLLPLVQKAHSATQSGFSLIRVLREMLESQEVAATADAINLLTVNASKPADDLISVLTSYVHDELAGQLTYDPITETVSPTDYGRKVKTGNVFSRVSNILYRHLPSREVNRNLIETVQNEYLRNYCQAQTVADWLQDNLQAHAEEVGDILRAESPAAVREAAVKLLQPAFEVYDWQDKHSQEALIRFLGAIANRALNPGCVLHWVLLLTGDSRTGKTSFFEQLTPPKTQTVSLLPGDFRMNKVGEKVVGAGVVVLDELDTFTDRLDLGHLKSFITSSETHQRLAYRRDAVSMPHTYAIGATSNLDSLPEDDGAGMTRYVRCKVKGTVADGVRRVKFLMTNRDLMLAVGTALAQSGYPYNMDPEFMALTDPDRQMLVEAPEDAGTVAAFLGSILSVTYNEKDNSILKLTLRDICSLAGIDLKSRRMTSKIKAVLEEEGWEARLYRGRYRSWMPSDLPSDVEVISTHPDQVQRIRSNVANLGPLND